MAVLFTFAVPALITALVFIAFENAAECQYDH